MRNDIVRLPNLHLPRGSPSRTDIVCLVMTPEGISTSLLHSQPQGHRNMTQRNICFRNKASEIPQQTGRSTLETHDVVPHVKHFQHQSREEDEETEGYKSGLRRYSEENLSKSYDRLVPTGSEDEEGAESKTVPCTYALYEESRAAKSVKVMPVVSPPPLNLVTNDTQPVHPVTVHITSYHNSTTSASPRLA